MMLSPLSRYARWSSDYADPQWPVHVPLLLLGLCFGSMAVSGWQKGLFLGTSVFLLIGLTHALATGWTRPRDRVIAAVAKAAARVVAGDRSVRVDRGAVAGELVERFNELAEMIDHHEEDRRVLTAGITHELRTPLTILKGRLHAIEDGILEVRTGEAREMLRQVDHILRMVEDLGTLAHAELGQLALRPDRVDLRDIIRPVLADLRQVVHPHDITLALRHVPAAVIGDPVRLTQIVTNLLTNAVKHSPPGGTVTVTISVIGSLAVASIFDEGSGFAPADTEKLFMPFWRSAADRDSGRPGSGIGLALAATLAEKHEGHIRAENRSDRSGACFSLWLPLAQSEVVRNDIPCVAQSSGAASVFAGRWFDS